VIFFFNFNEYIIFSTLPLMSEKVLQEFSTRLLKAKSLLDNTKNQCLVLKKEALKLEKEYEEIQNQRKSAEMMEESLKNHYLQIKNSNDQESLKNAKEYEELNSLREMKKKLKRECEIAKADFSKNTMILEELVKERMNLERGSKQMTEKLEQISLEKKTLQEENDFNQASIQQYSAKIQDLKNEIKNMRLLISQSFGNELRGYVGKENTSASKENYYSKDNTN